MIALGGAVERVAGGEDEPLAPTGRRSDVRRLDDLRVLDLVGETRVRHVEDDLVACLDLVVVRTGRGRSCGDRRSPSSAPWPGRRCRDSGRGRAAGPGCLGALDDDVVGVVRSDRICRSLALLEPRLEPLASWCAFSGTPLARSIDCSAASSGNSASSGRELVGKLVLLNLAVDGGNRLLPSERDRHVASTTIPAVISAIERIPRTLASRQMMADGHGRLSPR